jgi:LysR family hca operon transcriptional activator
MMDDLELRHLRYFVALAGECHFGRAAAALSVTQPLVSRQVRALEKMLGVQLIQSTRPRVELTSAGALLFESAQQTLQQVERMSRAVQQAVLGRETLAIAFEPCSSFHGFPQLTRKLMRSMPNVRLEIHEMPANEHAHRLRSGQIDLAYGHKGEDADKIQFSLLSSEPLMIGLPSSHPLARRGHVKISELGDSFVFWHRSIAPSCYDYVQGVIRSQAPDPPPVKHFAPDHLKLLEMVAAGLGWTIAPACVGRAAHRGVSFRKIYGIQTRVDLGLTHLSVRHAALRGVIEAWKKLSGPSQRAPLATGIQST